MTTAMQDERLATLERETHALRERMARLERRVGGAAAVAPPPATPPAERRASFAPPAPERPATKAASGAAGSAPPRESAAPPALAPPRPTLRLEDLLGGRVLAWTGGLAIVLGIAFLLAIAVSRGWIGEGARTLLAGFGSAALLAAGVWLRERRGRTEAALAAGGAGIAGLFLTVVVGGPVYGVLPAAIALALALAIGGLATTLAVRWPARGIGALGIAGALLAPVLAGGPSNATTLALLWIAAASGAAVLVWQRWDWLAFAVFGIALPQWLAWVFGGDVATGGVLVVLVAFGVLNAGAAVGFELRVPSARLRISSALLLTANALVLALAGWHALDGSGAAGELWLAALATVHVAIGLGTSGSRVNRDVRLLALVLGVVLADVTIGAVLDGPALAGAWGMATTCFAVLARKLLAAGAAAAAARGARDEALLGAGLGGHLLLTVAQALLQAPPEAVFLGDSIAPAGHAAVATAAIAAFVAGRFAEDVRREWRMGLDAVALAGIAYLTVVALDGPLLVVALAAEAAALAAIARRERDAVAAGGSAVLLGAGLFHAVAFEAPPSALVAGLNGAGAGALALAAVAGGALLGARAASGAGLELTGGNARRVPERGSEGSPDDRRAAHLRTVLIGLAAVVLLYLASVLVVTAFAPGEEGSAVDLLDLRGHQLGQALLSGLWATVGVAVLVVGLRRDVGALRLGALALLGVTIAKVFLFDLAALTSMYRVASFIALGVLLLLAALAWERFRPRPLPDLRMQ